MLKVPKTVLFFEQIELLFQEKVNYTTKNALFEKFQKPSEQHGPAMLRKDKSCI
ncbi:MAG: hypothetical protein GY694_15710 [Gammaproteobacteria bacterium]|nr:hypothetical protein [Gammaproteobacteria bacterium]